MTDVIITLDAEVAVTITVLDPNGQPVPGAIVKLDGPTQEPYRTSDSGTVRLTELCRSGAYTLRVNPDRADLNPLDLERWSPRDETVRLRKPD